MNIVAASKYEDLKKVVGDKKAVQTSVQPKAKPARGVGLPHLFMPKLLSQSTNFQDWFWKELRSGGMLDTYVARERAMSARRMRKVKQRYHNYQPNNKSDVRLKAVVPAREFFRWRATDPDFFADDSNLKSLRRDNADAVVFV